MNAPADLNQPPLDLSQLALDRSPQSVSSMHGVSKPSRYHRMRPITRYVVPIGIVLGFVALLVAAAGRQWWPSTSVTVIPVIVKRADVQQTGIPVFRSPGWIEPRPTAITVAALAAGVIEELLVVEGQEVTKGQAIARLIAIDAELMVQQAKNTLAIREGELNRATAELDAATIRLANPVHLQVQLADAQSELAKAQTEIAKLPFLLAAAESNEQYALSSVEGKRAAGAGVSGRIVAQAESEHASAFAALQELRSRKPNLQREIDALTDKVDAVQKQIELLVEERRQVEEAKAKVQAAVAMRNEAELEVRQAELALDRNVVRAPMDGRVLRLVAGPGTRVMGLASNAEHSSSTVIEMYDPNRPQVRADVRLEDVPAVTRGQRVEIETASSKGVIQGRVLQLTSAANIQKNTLEVKVELIDPPPTVSPEMLVTATFLAPVLENSVQAETADVGLLIPNQLLQRGELGEFVWTVDSKHVARRQIVEVGQEIDGGLREIKSGLNATDKLIVGGMDGLSEGSSVDVKGDDQTLGIK